MSTIETQAANYLERELQMLVIKITDYYYEKNPVLMQRYGAAGRQHSISDTTFHLQFLIAALGCDSPDIFSSYNKWAVTMLQARGVKQEDLVANLQSIQEVLERYVPAELFPMVKSYLDQAIIAAAEPSQIAISFFEGDFLNSDLAKHYLESLLARKRDCAVEAVVDGVANGVSLQSLYVDVFPRVQREVGRLWQLNQISVAEEHYCSAATQLAISQLYPYVRSSWKANCRHQSVVAACVGNELHEIGMRTVADCLEANGWETIYLGANQPIQGVVDAITNSKSKVLALSVSMAFNVRRLSSFIEQVRSRTDVRVLVGGNVFRTTEGLWRKVGADAYAADAGEATERVKQLAAAA